MAASSNDSPYKYSTKARGVKKLEVRNRRNLFSSTLKHID